MKPYLFLLLLAVGLSANGQTINNRYWNPIKSPYMWDFGRFKEQMTVPNTLLSSADTGSIAYKNGRLHYKTIVGTDTIWIPIADSVNNYSSLTSMISVQRISERDSIPDNKRYEGLFAYVADSAKTYQLKGGIANINWQEFTSGTLVLIDTVINNVYYGSLNGFRSLSDTAVKTGYINDHGGGIFAIDPLDNTSVDDTALTVVITATGKRGKRQNFDGINYQLDWFIPPVANSDTSDKTTYIQAAYNKAKGKTLIYTKNRTYRYNQINLPTDANKSSVDFNFCKIFPAVILRGGGALHQFAPHRNDNNTGIYNGGTNNTIAPVVKKSGGFLFKNAICDLEKTNIRFATITTTSAYNTDIDLWEFDNCDTKDANLGGIAMFITQTASDTSAFLRQAKIDNCDFENFGPFNYITVDTAANIGDTIVAVRTTDSKPIIDKLAVGRYFLIGTHLTLTDTPAPDLTSGYATTNKIMRLKGFNINDHDSTKARLYFTTGSYSSTTGFNDSIKGLTAPVIPNAMITPTAAGEHNQLFFLPPMNGTSGTNKLTIVSHTTTNDARMKNFYPGVQFVFNTISPAIPSGRYTVTAVYADSIKFTPALNQSFSNATPVILGQPGDAMTFQGDIKKVTVYNNKVNGAGHSIAMSGYQRRGYYSDQLETNYDIQHNEFDVNWMSIEVGSVSNAAINMRTNSSNISIDSAAHFFLMTSPDNFRMTQKDFGFGNVKVLTGSAILDADVTGNNSHVVGDVVTWTGTHLVYKIIDFDTTGGQKKVVFARFDNMLRDTVAGGFETNLADVGTLRRPYSTVNGGTGIIRKASIIDNTFGDLTRVSGGSGYSVSGSVYEYDIQKNRFNATERVSLELEGDIANVIGNKFNQNVFTGDVPRYSITTGGAGRGQGYGTIYSAKAIIKDNEFNLIMPDKTGYYNNAGGIGVAPNSSSLNPQRELIISGNTFNGVRGNILNGGNVVVGGTQVSSFYYDKVDIRNNTVDLHPTYSNFGLWGLLYSKNTSIVNNTITKKYGNTPSILRVFFNGTYLPLALDTTKMNINVSGNSYPILPTLGLNYTPDRYFWNDNNDRVKTLANGALGVDENGKMKIISIPLETLVID